MKPRRHASRPEPVGSSGALGYTDPVLSALMVDVLVVVLLIPMWSSRPVGDVPSSALAWVVSALGAVLLLAVQAFAGLVVVEEAYRHALTVGSRIGLGRAPGLAGIQAPLGIAATYLIGIWSLSRVGDTPSWLSWAYGGAACAIVVAGLVAAQRGRAARERAPRSDSDASSPGRSP